MRRLKGLQLAQNCRSGSRSTGDKASPMRRGTSATEGAWHQGAAPGCCHANHVATPRYPWDQPINSHSDADAPRNVQHPEDMADRLAWCRVTTSSSYSTGRLATGRLRNLAPSVRCCLPVMRGDLTGQRSCGICERILDTSALPNVLPNVRAS
jgi:hypothetical protein